MGNSPFQKFLGGLLGGGGMVRLGIDRYIRLMHKDVKFRGPSGFLVKCSFVFSNSHNSGNFHPKEKNKISKSKLGLLYPIQKNI